MIRAIIFDCFGVLTTDAWLPFKQQHFGDDLMLFQQATDINKQADGGSITYDDFLSQIGELASVPTTEVRRAVSNNLPNKELFDYVSQLKKKYKIGLLSNASADWLPELFTAEQIGLFDATALSYETRATKPMPQAYEIVADRLGVPIGDCVFIDDQERFVTGAREAGMQAIWYKDNEQLLAELSALLADTED